ncbi:MAG: hypothetical protein H0U52_16220 [Chloroflexi bacterium]|nr:hypothetical protein [Chloroflexota bacterium]
MIAALYVQPGGSYYGLPDVDPWDEMRDARLYAGPYPVVAHPPCQRWGRYWYGGPSVRVRKTLGDDGGCFAAALASVRAWGGVLEHPEASRAWRAHSMIVPLRGGGWSVADDRGGWTCCVEQGAYGHRARKATWLYAFGVALPSLAWGRSKATVRLDDGHHSKEERELIRRPPANMTRAQREFRKRWLAKQAEAGSEWCSPERMGLRERAATPIPFRDLLISIAITHITSHEARVLP